MEKNKNGDDTGLNSHGLGTEKCGTFTTILGQGAPSFSKRFRQKEVYLNTIHDHFGLRKPRHSENVFARKRYTLIQFPTIVG